MRVTFDSNAWEPVFDLSGCKYAAIRQSIQTGKVKGYICEIGFRIEAIRKKERKHYFAQPHFEVHFEGLRPSADGDYVQFLSMGPRDEAHPGLPEQQAIKLGTALECGIKLLRAQAWMGLPAPPELRNPKVFVSDSECLLPGRESRQIIAADRIENLGVGKALFDEIGGWNLQPESEIEEKKFYKACAEWADGETVAAHIAYGNEFLCTNDFGLSGTRSIFSSQNRDWLETEYGVRFITLDQLLELAAPRLA